MRLHASRRESKAGAMYNQLVIPRGGVATEPGDNEAREVTDSSHVTLRRMEEYDRTKIGKCLAWFGDNFVYEYGDSEVIKFSKFNFLLGPKKALAKNIRDQTFCKELFGKYYLATKVVRSPDRRWVALIQPKIVGSFLKPIHLEHAGVRAQFTEFMHFYKESQNLGHSTIDLIGGRGALSNTMTNIFITPNKSLVFFDALLFSLKEFPVPFRFLLWPLWALASVLQARTVKIFEKHLKKYSDAI